MFFSLKKPKMITYDILKIERKKTNYLKLKIYKYKSNKISQEDIYL